MKKHLSFFDMYEIKIILIINVHRENIYTRISIYIIPQKHETIPNKIFVFFCKFVSVGSINISIFIVFLSYQLVLLYIEVFVYSSKKMIMILFFFIEIKPTFRKYTKSGILDCIVKYQIFYIWLMAI